MTSLKTVAIVGDYSPIILDKLERRLSSNFNCIWISKREDFYKLKEADYMILRGFKIDADTLDAFGEKLKLIQRWGVGYDGVDIEHAGKLGIAVAITSGVNANAVSELVIGLIIALYRHLIPLHNALVSGTWNQKDYFDETFEIKGKTVGLLGCGNIGRLVARKVQAFDAHVVYYDPCRLPLEREHELALRYLEVDELLSQSDIVSLHMPAIPETQGLVNESFIAKMKHSAVLINTARGSIVNEPDLYNALRQRQIFGAGLDTFAQEPTSPDNPLLQLDNVVTTPHIGGNTADTRDEMIKHVADNIFRIERNELLPPGDLVNGQFLKNN
ncbi:MAG TPA: 3-phosphoglycerate dehydrogenase [Tepidanaerobacter syntrophicus]|nr:3-phosphoglycerate dehydrogenase [Tepidanaerobacter syntrophicus]